MLASSAWTTSRRSPASRGCPSRGSRTGARRAAARRPTCKTVALAHVDPAKVEFARGYQERYPTPVDAPDGRRAACCARASRRSSTTSTTSCWTPTIPDAGAAARARRSGMRALMARPDGHRRAGDRRDLVRQRRVRPRLHRRRPRAGRGARPPRRHRGRERPPVPRALAHRARRCSAGCCPTRSRAIPGLRLSSLYRPAGEENLVGGDFYDAFQTDARLDAARRRRHRPRRRGRRPDRPGAPHAAHRGPAAGRSGGRAGSSSTGRWPTAAS